MIAAENGGERNYSAAARERRLWLAVIAQAVEDWRSVNLKRQREAEAFLFGGRKDFECVCASAGLDARNLVDKLARLRSLSLSAERRSNAA
jgi:hypothetical protein